MAQGGSFETGALTGAISAGTSFAMESNQLGVVGSTKGLAVRTAVAAVAGGSASVLSGGKFANGAVTGAMGHLFNQEGGALAVRKFYHDLDVNRIAGEMKESGWIVLHNEAEMGRLGTRVPGLGIRFYDIVAENPFDARIYGIEVKTTVGDEWALRWSQVAKDRQVAKYGATTTSNIQIQGVGYAGATLGAVRSATWSTTTLVNSLLGSGVVMRPEFWKANKQD